MAALIRRLRFFRRADSGQALVEFAMAMPVFLLMFAGMSDFALLFKSYQTSLNAAREGARIAVLQGYDANFYEQPKERAKDYMEAGGLVCSGCVAAAEVDVDLGGGRTAKGVVVTVSYTYNFLFMGRVIGLISGTFRSDLPFVVTSTMRNEVQSS